MIRLRHVVPTLSLLCHRARARSFALMWLMILNSAVSGLNVAGSYKTFGTKQVVLPPPSPPPPPSLPLLPPCLSCLPATSQAAPSGGVPPPTAAAAQLRHVSVARRLPRGHLWQRGKVQSAAKASLAPEATASEEPGAKRTASLTAVRPCNHATIAGNAAGRFFWGGVSDVAGFKRPFIVLTLLQSATMLMCASRHATPRTPPPNLPASWQTPSHVARVRCHAAPHARHQQPHCQQKWQPHASSPAHLWQVQPAGADARDLRACDGARHIHAARRPSVLLALLTHPPRASTPLPSAVCMPLPPCGPATCFYPPRFTPPHTPSAVCSSACRS